ncbi:MAG: transmembrane prediction [Opitutia bacterium]|nr:DUF4159 domain-containing protein [Opitutaceae bacterium]PHX85079.1 MAG: transmembrane prediction [Opitutae bacterium]
MMTLRKVLKITSVVLLTVGGVAGFAQFGPNDPNPFRFGSGGSGGWGGRGNSNSPIIRTEGGVLVDEDSVRTARETAPNSTDTPLWRNRPGFEKDVFTFARVIFKSADDSGYRGNYGWGRGPHLNWWVDFPDADLNFSFRLQQMTSIRADSDGRVLKLTDPELGNYPFLYMTHPGYIKLSDAEVTALSGYLRNGGVVLVNDFWSALDWENFEVQMRRVLPGRAWSELDVNHPIFNCVYKIEGPMQRLQVPTLQFWDRNFDPKDPNSRLQRVDRGEGSETMHVRAWHDDRQRISILAIHNSDVADGWEREGEYEDYFKTFSEKIAYPLGVNIVFYLMTH